MDSYHNEPAPAQPSGLAARGTGDLPLGWLGERAGDSAAQARLDQPRSAHEIALRNILRMCQDTRTGYCKDNPLYSDCIIQIYNILRYTKDVLGLPQDRDFLE